ncbi:hypothetical protein [Nonomuraea turcica]|uniref:hypothetical protein n=1 Tax=Nonomuraea sp. G32 TaxID=3067274 RepID=UPI00273A9673|nr:hypothetical protein [Nonomuraea sp. G32]MDP4504915.1 hypothetical protein [Nonomuraea sp. G32]
MNDTEPQTSGGKVLWHFTMSLDGFVAVPNHTTDWMTRMSSRPGLIDQYTHHPEDATPADDVTFLNCEACPC